MRHSVYVATTIIYGILGIAGIVWTIASAILRDYLLLGLGLIFAYVSFDNFFCGTHARSCGYKIEGHYIIPPFMKKITLKKSIEGDNDGKR